MGKLCPTRAQVEPCFGIELEVLILVVRAHAGVAFAGMASRALARVRTRSSVAARFVRVTAKSRSWSSGTLALVVHEV